MVSCRTGAVHCPVEVVTVEMNNIGRRGFLTGLIGSVAAGKVIVEASDADIVRFGTKVGEPTVLAPGAINIPPPKPGQDWHEAVNRGAMSGGMWLLYNHAGEAVAAVRNASVTVPLEGQVEMHLDVVPFGPACHRWIVNTGIREQELRKLGKK